jgi:hypothetical protein
MDGQYVHANAKLVKALCRPRDALLLSYHFRQVCAGCNPGRRAKARSPKCTAGGSRWSHRINVPRHGAYAAKAAENQPDQAEPNKEADEEGWRCSQSRANPSPLQNCLLTGKNREILCFSTA